MININIDDILKLTKFENPSSRFNDLNHRYRIHRSRLIKLMKLLFRKDVLNLDAIYFSDYKQSIIQTKSKWNWKTPLLIKKKYLNSIISMILLNSKRKEEVEYNFSDFIFQDLTKINPLTFKIGDEFSLKQEKVDSLNHILITLPIVKKFNLKNIKIPKEAINEIEKKHNLVDWQILDLSYIKEIEADNVQQTYSSIEAFFNSFIMEKKTITSFKLFFAEHTNSELNEDKIIFALKVMWLSLSLEKVVSYSYIPSIISVSNEKKQISSGGFVIPQFNNYNSITNLLHPLYQIVNNWFTENAINDFSKKIENETEKKTNIRIIHSNYSLIKQIDEQWKELQEKEFKLDIPKRKINENIKILKKRADIILDLDKRIQRGKRDYSFILSKRSILEIIKKSLPLLKTDYESAQNIDEVILEEKYCDWLDYKLPKKKPFIIESSFEILFSELIDNALKNTQNILGTGISVFLELKKEFVFTLKIENDIQMPELIVDYYNSGFNPEIISNNWIYIGNGINIIKDCATIVNATFDVKNMNSKTSMTVEIPLYKKNE